MAQQKRGLRQEIWQTRTREGGVVTMDRARGALHEVQRDFQIALQLFPRAQASRHRGQGLQEGRDGAAIRRALHALDQGHDIRQRLLAHQIGGSGPLFHKRQHRFDAAPQFANEARRFKIGLETLAAQKHQGFGHDLLEHLFNLRKAGIKEGPIFGHQGMLVGGISFYHRDLNSSRNTLSSRRGRPLCLP